MPAGLEINLVVPDLWQQEAVRALREEKDVVVQAPTGSGKTYIFELLYPSLKGQAIFTVPTRALANDKLAEWRARGWDVGIATGDLALNLNAKILVATLETQRARFLRRDGPKLLVVDEYQMIADPVRGVHYELALALAPPHTQLLLLSGSVQNPQDVVAWLRRIGRNPVLISHEERPVPLEEIDLRALPDSAFVQTKSFWPRMIGKALRAELAPVLVFAPRRNASEEMAHTIASAMSLRDPLPLSAEQEALAGKKLAKLLRSRVAYHHSGLSYAVRAGLIEPLAKAGQLNVVVATMGLAAGINFSMRSVLITDTRYKAGNFERHVEPDELLQMFGRAGRRGLDDVGYVLMLPDIPRLGDGRPRKLKRATQVDWPSLISVMRGAADRGEQPFAAAVELSRSLFSTQNVPIGAEHSLTTGEKPCGLWVDAERGRFVRRPITEILNSVGEWEPKPATVENVSLGRLFVREYEKWALALSIPRVLDGHGFGNLCKLRDRGVYGREIPLATIVGDDAIAPVKWLRKNLVGRDAVEPRDKALSARQRLALPLSRAKFDEIVLPLLPEITGGQIAEIITRANTISARIDFSENQLNALIDSHGVALLDPPEREALPIVCRQCSELEHDLTTTITSSPAYAWRQLGLVEKDGTPTRRGLLFSFFHAGEGLAIAAGLEDETYPVDDLVFDLANIRAGPRFAGEDAPLGGRLGILCQQAYGRADHSGYLEMGVPVQYGSGASEVIRELATNSSTRYRFTNESLRHGDIERALMEWRSLLRHIVGAPDLEWERWRVLKKLAAHFVGSTTSPAAVEFPPLLASQRIGRIGRI
ncbi:MAG TPA: DEAD/DEAH box helicase [Chthoniobacterales bacterium]|jgi:superfamily II DNA/RNA helicase|nr:DEAD/DEAH box helicase [Chthoniobacterales bacterium]